MILGVNIIMGVGMTVGHDSVDMTVGVSLTVTWNCGCECDCGSRHTSGGDWM